MSHRAPFALLVLLPLLSPCARAQQSATIFDAPLAVVTSDHHFELLLDLNNDGFMDVISSKRNTSRIYVTSWLNDGTGDLRAVWTRQVTVYDSHTQGAYGRRCDLNGDAYDDFYFLVPSVGPFTGGFHAFVADPVVPGRFEEYEGLEMGSGPQFIEVADFDGDGYPDRASASGYALTMYLVAPDGAGSWDYSITVQPLGAEVEGLCMLDCNGDGTQDLYAEFGGHGAFVPVVGGVMQTPIPVAHGLASPMPMVIPGDVDGDGDEDLSLFGESEYVVCRRTGPDDWSLESARVGGPAAKFCDVDGDGDLDGICCGGGTGNYPVYFSFPSTFYVSLNDGSGGFAPAFTFPGSGSRETAGGADLDHDGDIDLVAGHCIYYGRGPLTAPPMQRVYADEPGRHLLLDFDLDGDPDFTPGLERFQRNLGDGSSHGFRPHAPTPAAGTSYVGPGIPGDWDGDGDVDLIVRHEDGSGFLGMRLLSNDGGGHYTDGGLAGTEDFMPPLLDDVSPENAFTLDLDGDGDQDLVTFQQSSTFQGHTTWTWLNDGQGQFTLGAKRYNITPIAFGRVWGSPDMDGIFLSINSQNALLLAGHGDGQFDFQSSLELPYGSLPFRPAIADFDGDGDEDVAAALDTGQGAGWFIPNVGGSLSMAYAEEIADLQSYNAFYTAPRIAEAGDFNADGLLDVLFSSPVNVRAGVAIVLRKGDNSGWEEPVVQAVYPAGTSTVVRADLGGALDVDGDGDVDFVNDAIWRNVAWSDPEGGRRLQQRGGRPDVNGLLPTLGASGPFRVGEQAKIRLTGAPGGTTGWLQVTIGTPAPPLSGGLVSWAGVQRPLVVLPFTTSGASGVPGVGQWTLEYTIPGYVPGLTKVYRAILSDPNSPGNEVWTSALRITYGL